MELINKKGMSKEFKVTMSLKYQDKIYVLYTLNDSVYHLGRVHQNKLKALNNSEYEEIKGIIEKVVRA